MNIQDMAWKIYAAVYGDLDDKYFESDKVGEIWDWLEEGDFDGSETLALLVREWRVYDAFDIASRLG